MVGKVGLHRGAELKQRMTDETLEELLAQERRSRFYKLRSKDSKGRKQRRYHVPVIPSYRTVEITGAPVKIQLPEGSRWAYINVVEVGEGNACTVDLWFLAPKMEVDTIRTFLLSRNDEVVEPPEGHNLTHRGSDVTTDHQTMIHCFEVERTAK